MNDYICLKCDKFRLTDAKSQQGFCQIYQIKRDCLQGACVDFENIMKKCDLTDLDIKCSESNCDNCPIFKAKDDPYTFSYPPELDQMVAEAIRIMIEILPEAIQKTAEAIGNIDWNLVAQEAAIRNMQEVQKNAGDCDNSDNMRNIGDDLMDQQGEAEE